MKNTQIPNSHNNIKGSWEVINMCNNRHVIKIKGIRMMPILSFIDKLPGSVRIKYLKNLESLFMISEAIIIYRIKDM